MMWNVIWYLFIYGSMVGICFLWGWWLERARAYKQAKADLIKAQAHIKELELAHLEEAEELAIDYSIMATLIEEHTTQLADLHKHMDEHCGQLAQLGNIHIRIIGSAPMTPDYSYCGLDEEFHEENAYPEPIEQTPLPDWMNTHVEGLDAL